MSTDSYVGGDDPDTEGRTLPPYEGRRETADVDPPEQSAKDGAKVGGATGPVRTTRSKAPDPDATAAGRHRVAGRRAAGGPDAGERGERPGCRTGPHTRHHARRGRERQLMERQVLVAGIGNLFLGDDGFGPEVVRHLAAGPPLPEGVRLVDYGIRGMHLLYDLLDGYQALVIIDALPGRGRPGEVVVLEVGPADLERLGGDFDPHGMNPVAVLAGLPALGGQLPPTYVVGAAPENLADGIGLSPTLAGAVAPAAARVLRPARQPAVGPGRRGSEGLTTMCLGIPGQVVEVLEGYAGQLALVDVQGATRRINLGMLDPDDQQVRSGDWVLIHMGFALERIDQAGAERGPAWAAADGLGIGERARS